MVQRWNCYRNRDKTLREMGFQCYKDYLCSRLWRNIRAAVYKKKGRLCKACGRRATVLHHKSYKKDVLLGERLTPLVPLCEECHEGIEHTATGRKRNLYEANRALKSLVVRERKARLKRLKAKRRRLS